MLVELVPPPATTLAEPAAHVIFDTLPDIGLDRMTEGKVEFVLCVSALTAQV